MRSAVCAALVAALAVAPSAAVAASLPQTGRYKGQTGDGHVFQFSVERSHKAGSPRKITHLWLVYDIGVNLVYRVDDATRAMTLIDHVDSHVHLRVSTGEAKSSW